MPSIIYDNNLQCIYTIDIKYIENDQCLYNSNQ